MYGVLHMRTYLMWAVNYLAFYLLWVVCVVAAYYHVSLLTVPVVLLYLIAHLAFVSKAWREEALFIALLTVYGMMNESLLSLCGAISYEGALWEGVSWWTLGLWAVFATTYWHSFSWLRSRPIVSALLGAAVVPACYEWVNLMGAIQYPNGQTRAMISVGVLWALTLPCTFFISNAFQRRCEERK